MTLKELGLLFLIAGVCGLVAQALVGFSRGGILATVALGFVGALVGMVLADNLNLPTIYVLRLGGGSFPVVWAVVGSTLCVALLAAFSEKREKK